MKYNNNMLKDILIVNTVFMVVGFIFINIII